MPLVAAGSPAQHWVGASAGYSHQIPSSQTLAPPPLPLVSTRPPYQQPQYLPQLAHVKQQDTVLMQAVVEPIERQSPAWQAIHFGAGHDYMLPPPQPNQSDISGILVNFDNPNALMGLSNVGSGGDSNGNSNSPFDNNNTNNNLDNAINNGAIDHLVEQTAQQETPTIVVPFEALIARTPTPTLPQRTSTNLSPSMNLEEPLSLVADPFYMGDEVVLGQHV